jgi:hypothetical protein
LSRCVKNVTRLLFAAVSVLSQFLYSPVQQFLHLSVRYLYSHPAGSGLITVEQHGGPLIWQFVITEINKVAARSYVNPAGLENLGLLRIWELAIYGSINCGNRIKDPLWITDRNIFVYIRNTGRQILKSYSPI